MHGHDHDMTGGAATADPPSPVDGLVGALLGRRVRDLLVEVRPTGLVLRGRADSYHVKQLAQHAATAVTGLPVLANRIEVARPRGTSRPRPGEYEDAVARRPRAGVLLATDDDRLRAAAHDHLTDHGYAVATAAGGVECVGVLGEFVPDVILLDADLLWGGADGVLEHLRGGSGPGVPVVLLASPFAAPAGSGGGSPVVSVLEKPVAVGALLGAVRSATGGGSPARAGTQPAAGEEAPPPPARPPAGSSPRASAPAPGEQWPT
jgi:CheY-like chemotaxis protein